MRQVRILFYLVLFISFFAIFFAESLAYAQTPGDACSPTNFSSPIWVPGASSGGAGQLMVCDGSNWVLALEYGNDGAVIMGEATGASCSASTKGAIRYNSTSDYLEYCDGSSWAEIGSGEGGASSVALGTVFGDGTVYAGDTPDGDVAMYVTRCDAGQTWDGSSCTGSRLSTPWNDGNTSDLTQTSVTSVTAGQTNTASLITIDSDSYEEDTQPHQAAQYCSDLSAHGRSDWYLPAKDELDTIYDNNTEIGNFDTSDTYWSSSEEFTNTSWGQRFSDGLQSSSLKYINRTIRCARHD